MALGKSRQRGDEGSEEINISPLIDVVFILLIFFIVTTVFVEETGVEVTKPQASSAVDLDRLSIQIAIETNGNIVYGGKVVGVAGVRSLVKRLTQKEDRPVMIFSDREVPTHLLVSVIDAAKQGGAISVNIVADQ